MDPITQRIALGAAASEIERTEFFRMTDTYVFNDNYYGAPQYDSSNNIYAPGEYSPGVGSPCVAKFDEVGKLVWHKMLTNGSGESRAFRVIGSYMYLCSSIADADGAGNSGFYYAKLDLDANVIFEKKYYIAGTSDLGLFYGWPTIDNSGNVYVGVFNGDGTNGWGVMKIDSSGVLQWLNRAVATDTGWRTPTWAGFAVNESTGDSFVFGEKRRTGGTSQYTMGAVCIKYNSSGVRQFTQYYGPAQSVNLSQVDMTRASCDENGDVWIRGGNQTFALMKINPSNGTISQRYADQGTGLYGVRRDPSGRYWFTYVDSSFRVYNYNSGSNSFTGVWGYDDSFNQPQFVPHVTFNTSHNAFYFPFREGFLSLPYDGSLQGSTSTSGTWTYSTTTPATISTGSNDLYTYGDQGAISYTSVSGVTTTNLSSSITDFPVSAGWRAAYI